MLAMFDDYARRRMTLAAERGAIVSGCVVVPPLLSATVVGGWVMMLTLVSVLVVVLHAPSTMPAVPPAAVRMNRRRSMLRPCS